VLASTFAATFSVAAGLLRPIGGYVSDVLARNERDILPWFTGRYREQWTFLTLCFVVLTMVGMTFAGLSGEVLIAVGAGFLVGMGCAFAEGAIFAQVPAMFPDSSGTVAGVVGGVGTVGGIVYPLVYSSTLLPNLHVGYAIVAASMIPIVLLMPGSTARRSLGVRRRTAGSSARRGATRRPEATEMRSGLILAGGRSRGGRTSPSPKAGGR